MTRYIRVFEFLRDNPDVDADTISSRMGLPRSEVLQAMKGIVSCLPDGSLKKRRIDDQGRLAYSLADGCPFPDPSIRKQRKKRSHSELEQAIATRINNSERQWKLCELREVYNESLPKIQAIVTRLVNAKKISVLPRKSLKHKPTFCKLREELPPVQSGGISKMEGTYAHWANTAPRDGSLDPNRPHIGRYGS